MTLPPIFRLERDSVGPDGAFGRLLYLGQEIAKTLERTYEHPGEPVIKIPPGIYRCTRTRFFRGAYDTYEIHVPGHERILIHIANVEAQLDGCVALGIEHGTLDGKPAVLRSKEAFDKFMDCAANAPEFYLEVA